MKDELPQSDYTSYFFKDDNEEKILRPIEISLLKAEKLWKTNPTDALVEYKNIINTDSLSEFSSSAAYFFIRYMLGTPTLSSDSFKKNTIQIVKTNYNNIIIH